MKNRKGFTLVEILAVVVILSILSAVVVPTVYSMIKKAKSNSYDVLLNTIEENARLYISRHKDTVESGLDTNHYYLITLDDLKNDNLLVSPITDPRTDTTIALTKKIIVTRETAKYLSVCFEDRGCYIPILLVNKLTEEGNVVSGTTEGLHYNSSSDIYYYMGANPNNWLKFNDYLWRIIRINSDDTVKLVFEGTSSNNGINENGYISNGAYAASNSNNYNNSITIKNTLQNWYDLNISSSNKSKVDSRKYCIGQVSYSTSGTAKDTFWSTECGTLTTNNLSVGLIGGSDYLYASLDANCLTSYKTTGDNGTSCKNKNYLYKNYQYWTMTGDTTASGVWAVNQALGAPVSANTSSYVRPVITLDIGINVDKGTGTYDNPYQLSNIVNIDKEKPVITLVGSTPVNVALGGSYTDAGATATDNVDGDITSKINVYTDLNTNKRGTYTVTYNVSDTAGNTATLKRTVLVGDFEKPVITLLGSNPTNISTGSTYTDEGATATDNVDGNITARITTTSNVNANVSGTYTVTYNVSDTAGNVADTVTRTVNVVTSATFAYTGAVQTFNVPYTGNYKLEVWGAAGGGYSANEYGKGGYSTGTVSLTQGQSIYVYVGGAGATGFPGGTIAGGWNGGGTITGASSDGNNGSGGGGTDIRIGGTALSNRVIVAGGGGGGVATMTQVGHGGGTSGLNSIFQSTGETATGGSQTSGGSGSFSGSLGQGASGYRAGGGGGYYGGGGTSYGAAGGSGYIGGVTSGQTIAGNASMPAPAGGTETGHTGNGYAKITKTQ